jgi:hypothetical protein
VKNVVEVRVDGNMDQITDRLGSGYHYGWVWASSDNALLENQRAYAIKKEDRHQALPDSQVEGLTVLKNHS